MTGSQQIIDLELVSHDIQALNNSDALAAFFARLGYDTDIRTSQSPGNLGIVADTTTRPIKRIELIANQENLFQVYLFELTSVTVAHTRLLAKTFRNRSGNFLLVLTSDYERLDFVLLEKYLPADKQGGLAIAQKQVGVRPRILTVERRKPSRIHLRVLRPNPILWRNMRNFSRPMTWPTGLKNFLITGHCSRIIILRSG